MARNLQSSNKHLTQEIDEREKVEQELRSTQQELEDRVAKRTAELSQSEQAQRRLAEENAVIAEIGRIVSSSPNIDEVYEQCAERVRELIPIDGLSAGIIDYENEQTFVSFHYGQDVRERKRGATVPLKGTLTEKVIKLVLRHT